MHKGLYWLLLITFISIAVFGFLAMGHASNGHMHGGCIAAAARASTCESDADDSFFHINVFKSFSQAMISSAMLFISALLFLFWISQLARKTVTSLVSYLYAVGEPLRYRMRIFSGMLRYRARVYFMKWCSLQRGDAQHTLARAYEYGISLV
ncbi:MAG: hypothetical protein Q7S48_05165 [bacterium]|nr:hypothetical protein [bacterium]